MGLGNLQGRARTSASSPRAKAECDSCGIWYPHASLKRQEQWAGYRLADSGTLVCPRCYDTPNQQYRTIILPPDPVPVRNPRPSLDGSSGTGPDS